LMELQASFVARQQFLTLVTLARDLAYIFKLSPSSLSSACCKTANLYPRIMEIYSPPFFGMSIHYLRCQTIPSMF
jgi:hypothetical protein